MSTEVKTEFYPVVGRKDTGKSFDRLPIEKLQKEHPEQFTLFILAYLQIQGRPLPINSPVVSATGEVEGPIPLPPGSGAIPNTFFDIGSIHGKPYQPWKGEPKRVRTDFDYDDPKDTMPVPSRFGGYCNHGSVLFPTWHRPYVLLIEQAIGEKATALAESLEKLEAKEKKGVWTKAAQELRFPYWDWAEKRVETDGIPAVLVDEKVNILLPPFGEYHQIENPIAWFPINTIPSFPADFVNEVDDVDPKVVSYFKSWKHTMRYPDSDPDASTGNTEELQAEFKESAAALRKRVARLFAYDDSQDNARAWDEYSNHTSVSTGKSTGYGLGSLEGVHDSMHVILGGLGHMSFPDYAGFDPIFYLHHANVDRLYALWEYCFPQHWMGNGWKSRGGSLVPWVQTAGTYTQVYNAQVLPDTGLVPFRTDTGDYWTSDQSRFLDAKAYPKYYAYEATAGIRVDQDATPEQRLKARKALQEYYGYIPDPPKPRAGIAAANLARSHPIFKSPDVERNDTRTVAGYREFAVAVELLEHAYNGPYTFKLYHTLNKETVPVLLGRVDVFARPDHSQCADCSRRRAAGSTVRGTIFIDISIVDNIIEGSQSNRGPGASTQDLISKVKDSFSAELTNTRQEKLAVAGVEHQVSTHWNEISASEAPVTLTLLSSAVAYKGTRGGPLSMVGWDDHGEIFTGHAWKRHI